MHYHEISWFSLYHEIQNSGACPNNASITYFFILAEIKPIIFAEAQEKTQEGETAFGEIRNAKAVELGNLIIYIMTT